MCQADENGSAIMLGWALVYGLGVAVGAGVVALVWWLS